MAKLKISDFDTNPDNNTDINSINIAEGCAPSGINNAIRQLMSDLKEFQTGAASDAFTVGGAFSANGGATLGDATGDALTINSSAVSIPNGLNFGSNNLVLSSGNVGIGTSSPGAKLNVVGNTLIPLNNSYYCYTSNFGMGTGTGLEIFTDTGEVIRFLTGGKSGTERMRIDSSGNLLVGTTTASPVTSSGFKFLKNYESAGNDRTSIVFPSSTGGVPFTLYSTGAAAYRFYVDSAGTISATNTTISSLSDQRLKENIRDLDDGLEKVLALQPRKFDWKEGKGANIKDARGFIAQEFETVFPDMIDKWLTPAPEGEEPYKAVNANLIPTLVKAIQEQQAIITDLKSRIETLESK